MVCKGKNWIPADYGRTTVNKNPKPENKVYKSPVSKKVNQNTKPLEKNNIL